ncbi:MAG: biotin--[acetyl-CoA-carboxylase] ligase [Bacteroidales bacterium]|nr:biotin--[acetyl-CoA-carboxylase] ligase [Bacteroidales bacterium]
MKIGSPIIHVQSVSSTNTHAAEVISRNEAVNGMVINALEQTEGKGQNQNRWESRAGENLTFSIVVQPTGLPSSKQFLLNKMASLALKDFVQAHLTDSDIRIKWPNDIYCNNRKIAGILINNTILGEKITWTILGVGINVNQTVFLSDAPNPVSLKMISGIHYDLELCLKMLCHYIEIRFKQLLEKKYTKIDQDYIGSLYRFGMLSDFVYKGQAIKAKITGIGEFGHLELETLQGRKLSCDLNEVKHVI